MAKRLGSVKQRNILQYSTALGAMAFAAMTPGVTLAQETAADESSDAIVVTGTRIPRQDYVSTNPVVTMDAQAIQQTGATNLTDFVQDMPALLNSFDMEDSADTGGQALVGLNLLDLRNLGTERTLVLVNGRRHVAGLAGTQSVDVNSIPLGLVERIEVLTGGASAVYGADGVSGVVNFIMRDDFDGLEARAQTGWTDDGGGENNFASVIFGRNIGNGLGNLTVAVDYSHTEALNSGDRDYARIGNREVLVRDFTFGTPGGGAYQNFFQRDVRYIDSSAGGSVYTDFDFGDSLSGADFEGDGDPWVSGLNTGNFTMVGGSGSLLDQFVDELLPYQERFSINGMGHINLSPNMRLFAEAKYANTDTEFEAQATFDFFLFIPVDNPFIPANILADALTPGNIGDAYGGVFVDRDNFDLGSTTRQVTRETFRATVGIDGAVTDSINYELSLTYGATYAESNYRTRNNERFFAAIDAVDDGSGNIVCRSTLGLPGYSPDNWTGPSFGYSFTPGAGDGCIPANIFGPNISQAAADWINHNVFSSDRIDQTVLAGFVAGETPLSLPGGQVEFALGAEYRRETSDSNTSYWEALGTQEGTDISWAGQGADVSGEFDVWEAFGELSIPILRDIPVFEELGVDLAYRYSNYSTIGSTETWRVGGRWRITEGLMLRGTQARAVRAPNIGELFTPQVQTFALLVDPCDDDNVTAGTSERFGNCDAALLALGAPGAGTFNNTLSAAVEGRIGGNPDLEPEEADTTTAGIVFQPGFIPGLSVSLDWYKIEISDAIQAFTAQTILDKCYDLPQPNSFCSLITRDTGTGLLSGFQQYTVNVASYETTGYDLTIRYLFDPADIMPSWNFGSFQFQLVGNKLEDLTFTELPGAAPDNTAGDPGAPEHQVTFDATWNWGGFTLNYGYRWFDETRRFTVERQASNPLWVPPSYWHYSERSVHNIYAQYEFAERFTLYGGVNNLNNQEPDRGSLQDPVSPLGRYFYVGAKVSLN